VDIFINIIVGMTGVWLIGTAFIMLTENFISSMAFKVIPFFLGLGCILSVCFRLSKMFPYH
jgi:hypothetical protein